MSLVVIEEIGHQESILTMVFDKRVIRVALRMVVLACKGQRNGITIRGCRLPMRHRREDHGKLECLWGDLFELLQGQSVKQFAFLLIPLSLG